MNDIRSETNRFEAWLAAHTTVFAPHLQLKHRSMVADSFAFLRATFYRWAQIFTSLCPKLMDAPPVLGVGDLHIANYGTWRDAEGRLVWGINDFDEATHLPYTNDLVRLATSARIALQADHLAISPRRAVAAILEGYTRNLEHGGKPFVLAEKHAWLRDAVTGKMRDHAKFWEKLDALGTARNVPAQVKVLFQSALPVESENVRIVQRVAGLGSLGRPRYTALADCCGGKVAREAKALLPSAWHWATGNETEQTIRYGDILEQSIRSPDPFIDLPPGWIIRRLSPYCSRIDLNQLSLGRYEKKLLTAMGAELANIHLGDKKVADRILRDLAQRDTDWLVTVSKTMTDATLADWNIWRGKGP